MARPSALPARASSTHRTQRSIAVQRPTTTECARFHGLSCADGSSRSSTCVAPRREHPRPRRLARSTGRPAWRESRRAHSHAHADLPVEPLQAQHVRAARVVSILCFHPHVAVDHAPGLTPFLRTRNVTTRATRYGVEYTSLRRRGILRLCMSGSYARRSQLRETLATCRWPMLARVAEIDRYGQRMGMNIAFVRGRPAQRDQPCRYTRLLSWLRTRHDHSTADPTANQA